MPKLKLTYKPYTLKLKEAFTLSTSSRTETPIVLTEIEYEGTTGYGEASLPPYLGETQEFVIKFLSKINLEKFQDPFDLETILFEIDKIEEKNFAAKASIDIALHDLIGKLMNQPLYNIFGLPKDKTPFTSYTLSIDSIENLKRKAEKISKEFKIIKIKLGRENDKEIIEAIRSVTNIPISVDANQGWKDKFYALEMCNYLNEKNCLFIEQPLPKEMIDETAWLTSQSPLPIIADEAVQRLSDVKNAYGIYSGINIKLMKSTGIREAYKMIILARALGMKVMLGCMTETSCAISAAAQISSLVDWADLDGALLISNDVFEGAKIINGKIELNNLPGIGVRKI